MKRYRNLASYSIVVSILTIMLALVTTNEEGKDDKHHTALAKETEVVKERTQMSSVTTMVQEDAVRLHDRISETPKEETNKEIERKLYYRVTSEWLNIREMASPSSKITGFLVRDDAVQVLELTNGWFKLKEGGYISSNFVTLSTYEEATKLISQQEQRHVAALQRLREEKIRQEKLRQQQLEKAQQQIAPVSVSQPITPATGVNLNIASKSNLTAVHLGELLQGTNLAGIEHALLQVEDKFGINALFTLAVAKLESGNGNSRLARNKNNLFGMNAVDSDPYNKAFTYGSKAESVLHFGDVMNRVYFKQGLTTLVSINSKYSSSSAWAGKVNSIMNADYARVVN